MLVTRFSVPPARISVIGNTPSTIAGRVRHHSELPGGFVGGRGGQLRILGVGRLAPQKDPERFVRIVAELSKTVDVEAVWIGDGDLRSQVESANQRLGNHVAFVGLKPDAGPWFESADLLLMTSAWEGLPLVALEALAAEVPIFAPDIDGLSSLLGRDHRESGYTYPQDAADAVVSALIAGAIGSDELNKRVSRGKQLVADEFSPDRVFGAVEEVYGRLVR